MPASRRRSASVTLGITALLAASLTACGSDEQTDVDNVAVCVDPNTNQRVEDDRCGDADRNYQGSGIGSAFLWYYLGTRSGGRYPAVGGPISGGTFNSPRGATVQRGGASKTGGSITRGGFGSSGKSSGS